MEQASGQPERGHPGAHEGIAQRGQGERAGREHHEPGAVEEAAPDLEGRGVEGEGGELEEHLVGAPPDVGRAHDEAHDGAVGHAHALGPPGRARGVHHRGQALGGRLVGWRRVGLGGDLGPVRVEPDQLPRDLRHPGREVSLGEDHRRPGVPQQEAKAVGRGRAVERHVGAAGFQDAEDAHDHLQRPLDEEGNRRLYAHPGAAQEPRELVGPLIQGPVGERPISADDGDRVGRACGLGREELVDTRVPRVVALGASAVHQQRGALLLTDQGQPRAGPVGVVDDRLDQGLEVRAHSRDGGPFEQGRVVAEVADHRPRVGGEREEQIELGQHRLRG